MLSTERTGVCIWVCRSVHTAAHRVAGRHLPGAHKRFPFLLQATMDWEAQEDGFIAKILAGDGSKDIAVGAPVLVFVEDEVSLPAGLKSTATSPAQHNMQGHVVCMVCHSCPWPCWAVHLGLQLNKAASSRLLFCVCQAAHYWWLQAGGLLSVLTFASLWTA